VIAGEGDVQPASLDGHVGFIMVIVVGDLADRVGSGRGLDCAVVLPG
jgi:hypothetical protein